MGNIEVGKDVIEIMFKDMMSKVRWWQFKKKRQILEWKQNMLNKKQ